MARIKAIVIGVCICVVYSTLGLARDLIPKEVFSNDVNPEIISVIEQVCADKLNLSHEKPDRSSYKLLKIRQNTETVVPILIQLLKSTDTVVVECAAVALAEIGDPRAVEPLIVALDVSIPPRYFGSPGEKKLMTPVVEASVSKFEDPKTVDLLIAHIAKKGGKAEDFPFAALPDNLPEIIRYQTVEGLLNGINNEGYTVPAIAILGHIKEQRAIKPIVAILKNKKNSIDIRAKAAVGLYQFADYEVEKVLLKVAEDEKEEAEIRGSAIHALRWNTYLGENGFQIQKRNLNQRTCRALVKLDKKSLAGHKISEIYGESRWYDYKSRCQMYTKEAREAIVDLEETVNTGTGTGIQPWR